MLSGSSFFLTAAGEPIAMLVAKALPMLYRHRRILFRSEPLVPSWGAIVPPIICSICSISDICLNTDSIQIVHLPQGNVEMIRDSV